MSDLSALYFEAHVTIEPVFGPRLAEAQLISERYRFRVADLLMQKREVDTAERSSRDTFITGRGKSYSDLLVRMAGLIADLTAKGFAVWRYKIEDTIIDSRSLDVLQLDVGK